MAKVGIFDTPPQKWFKYDDDTEVLIQFVDKDAMAKLVRSGEDAAKKLKEDSNVLLDVFLGKKAVLDWRHVDQEKCPGHPGLVLPDGSPIPFNGENRNMLMRRCSAFARFVLAKAATESGFLEDQPLTLADDNTTLETLLDEMDGDDDPKNG